ncbi:MAG: DUF1998 domain-containing protein [Lamprobacter sp.]|uniref:DUF1998 domain-containing protein n=1 Tax=Lamprobacter sp. TaxID=3100796 RepID=UPI002B260C0B|nr:DUF1998 domain-containing protein [Lamprobacter sp.]MEA3640224.1 DUF1998 domain-containing protein [Lamprobacter sp.]
MGHHVTPARPVGSVRRSQLISTYSIGAIIDLEGGSFMPMGLEDWESQVRGGRIGAMSINESRLQRQLGVTHFRLPPTETPIENQPSRVDSRYTIPVVRFPAWHECPSCHRLGTEDHPFLLHSDGNRLTCSNQKCQSRIVTPVRFVVACDHGHIEDFPWVWWAHRKSAEGICSQPRVYLRSHAKSASLADLYVRCDGCGASSTMGDAFRPGSVRGRQCGGVRPWLVDRQICDQTPRVLQRGASNIHFSTVVSAISIPPISEPLLQILDDYWTVLKTIPQSALPDALAGVAEQYGVPVESLIDAHGQKTGVETGGTYTDAMARLDEYVALGSTRDDEDPIGGYAPQFLNRVYDAPPGLSAWFDLIGAVSRLREVRALAAFSRIEPWPSGADRIQDEIEKGNLSPLSKNPMNWLPAAEILGEGIFLRFRVDAVEAWISDNPGIKDRAAALDAHAAAVAERRNYQPEYQITPRLLLVHSFAHAMIRQLSIDCGYSSSALRERLYLSEPADSSVMNGVLIYTGSPDSEGSLGGLVRLAHPDRIVDAVNRAVHTARWCGSDPVCLETDPHQSGERISGAACHCCLLVPETACEKFNRELDRSMLIGAADRSYRGFFETLSTREEA